MPAIEDLTSAVEQETSVETSLETLLSGIWQNIKGALSSGNLAAVEQSVNDHMHASSALAAAVTANTDKPDEVPPPVVEPPPPPPAPEPPRPAEDNGEGDGSDPRTQRFPDGTQF